MAKKLLFFFLLSGYWPMFSQKDFYEKVYPELINHKRDIQNFDDHNQDNVDMLSRDGSFLMVKKEAYNDISTGFKLSKFKPDGTLDATFKTDADLPEARYLASDIAQDTSGDIYVAGLRKRMGESDFDARCIIVKYSASGQRDKTFGNGEGCFSIDLNALWGWTGPKIALGKDGIFLQAHTVYSSKMESRISLLKVNPDGKYFDEGYFDAVRNSGQEFAWETNGSYVSHSMRLLTDGRILVCGACEESGIPGLGRKGFVAVFGKNLKLDKTFGADGILFLDANSKKVASVNDVAELKDGKLLALGTSRNEKSVNGKYEARIFLSRFTSDGKMDQTFANKGYSVFEEKFDDFGEKIKVFKDGNMAVVFHSTDDEHRKFAHKFFAIFDPDGKEAVPKKFDFSVYQHYVVWNFPYKSMLQKMVEEYDR